MPGMLSARAIICQFRKMSSVQSVGTVSLEYAAYHLTRRPQLPSHDKPVTLRCEIAPYSDLLVLHDRAGESGRKKIRLPSDSLCFRFHAQGSHTGDLSAILGHQTESASSEQSMSL
ncbi:Hypothetical protein GbCGDNIH2_0857 [Granulibacter bethesdensis]|uniref:Uncharacterized protein n=1 Tax=Granulibacter bethesdensis (strain ATCC BAA-1260 / CGDNIH1) TaxID=391165 RepID=Q0BTU7_GRABC|nr:Hypothetical protein GbCGDNIH1_0857 [Granulibacter bethesdensis CGDNIH1]APG30605.1 Hypothetical protein GbCGDNIH2_0857 [Granulibacter bethesdensis]APH51564.1 Hypothetical protein GbCGDNIH5_0857 [Granulibacter bethesdensis]APH64257.1 Hypothetical protein GbCGDNIH1I4_0857 [Granulibacter bethesdensis]